jgi:hypothetical protein
LFLHERGIVLPYYKLIKCGHVLEVYQYEKTPIQFDPAFEWGDDDRFPYHDIYEKGTEWEDKAWITESEKEEKRKEYNLYNANVRRNKLRRMILANFSSNSKFITLTFREHITDLDKANILFKQFIQRLRSRWGNFKYLAVIEFQKSGRVHYHMISDLPFIQKGLLYAIWQNRPISRSKESKFYCIGKAKVNIERYSECMDHWKETGKGIKPKREFFLEIDDIPRAAGGFVKINNISHVDNVGAYIVKYMTKESDNPALIGRKTYLYSQSLVKEEVIRGDTAEAIIEHMQLQTVTPVYTNSYDTHYFGRANYKEFNLKRLKGDV